MSPETSSGGSRRYHVTSFRPSDPIPFSTTSGDGVEGPTARVSTGGLSVTWSSNVRFLVPRRASRRMGQREDGTGTIRHRLTPTVTPFGRGLSATPVSLETLDVILVGVRLTESLFDF